MDDDLYLDEMELVAAAAGYNYYSSLAKIHRGDKSHSGAGFLVEVLTGEDEVFREMLRMDKHVFCKLSDILRKNAMLRDTHGVLIEEQLAMFLIIIGHREKNRVIQERFQHSGDTISRHFNSVLKAVKSLSREFLQSPLQSTPAEIRANKRFYPYFKDCIGVIDGMHLPAHVRLKDQSRFRDKKGMISQNVLAACTFDLKFIFVYPGWEGSASDARILRSVLTDPNQKFPSVPEGKYYLVDSDYANMEGFIAPFPDMRCHVREYRGADQLPKNPKELFNLRHASLRKSIQKSFEVLKTRFPIIKVASKYSFQTQRDIIIAACVIHNLIRCEEPNDWLFMAVEENGVDELTDMDEQVDMVPQSTMGESTMAFRDTVTTAMWNDFMTNWNQWYFKTWEHICVPSLIG